MGLRIIMKKGKETIFMYGSFGFQNCNRGSQTCTSIGVNQVIFPDDHKQEKVEFLSGNLDSRHSSYGFSPYLTLGWGVQYREIQSKITELFAATCI